MVIPVKLAALDTPTPSTFLLLMDDLDARQDRLLDRLVDRYVRPQTCDFDVIAAAYVSIAEELWAYGAWRAREQARFIGGCLP